MIITAKQKYVRCSSQKLKFVADSVRKMKLTQMRLQLAYLNKEPARRLLQTIDQAVANAQHNFGISADKLAIEKMMILTGPEYKRMRPVSRGQGHAILKRTSHIVIELKTMGQDTKQEVKSEDQIKPVEMIEAKITEPVKKVTKKVVKKETKKKE